MGGSIEVKGRVLYASQEPWVFSGTLRENILFGQPYRWDWYNTVMEACTLDKVGGSNGGDGRGLREGRGREERERGREREGRGRKEEEMDGMREGGGGIEGGGMGGERR